MEDFLKTNVRLLIVEDDLSTLEVLTFQLERQGYTVLALDEAEKALEVLEKQPVDLVITDVSMPKMDGLAFLDQIRQLWPDLPVILLSGYGSVEMAVEAMKRGAADFIAKPASFSEISIRIERALEGAENKKAYRMLKEQVEELKKACEDFGKTNENHFQSEKLDAMGLIVSGIAHEINNPLTAVIGYSQLLLDTGGQDMSRQLRVVRDQAQRCAKIIQELMFFARRRKPIFSRVNLYDVMEETLQELKGEFEARQITVLFPPVNQELLVSGDSKLLKKVFSQILLNAAHALETVPRSRKIDVCMEDRGERVQIEILDNGPGIPAEHLPKIFDPFFSTKEVGRGTGLGLSLCYGLIADHRGRISARSGKEGGTCFTVILPKQSVSSTAA